MNLKSNQGKAHLIGLNTVLLILPLLVGCEKVIDAANDQLPGDIAPETPGEPAAPKSNSAPIAQDLNIELSTADGTKSATLLGSDLEDSLLLFSIVNMPAHGTLDLTALNGAFTYTPNSGFSGPDSFTYIVGDGKLISNTGRVNIVVTAVNNSSPVALSLTPNALSEDVESIISLQYTDADLDLASSCSISSLVNSLESTPCSCTVGICTVGIKGTSHYSGAASFAYTVSAEGQTSNSVSVDLTISAVNDAPSATALSFSTNEDSTYASNGSSRAHLSGSDVEASSLTCAKVSDPSHGAVTVNSDCSFS